MNKLYTSSCGDIISYEKPFEYKTKKDLLKKVESLEKWHPISMFSFLLEVPTHLLTEHILLKVVKKNGLALKYIKNQTEKICKTAVKESVTSLKYVQKQTPEMCLIALKNKKFHKEILKTINIINRNHLTNVDECIAQFKIIIKKKKVIMEKL